MAETVRLATTQADYCEPPAEANPFSDVFSLEAARNHAKARVEFHAALLDQAGTGGADLAVGEEDIAGLHYPLVYLDDPSVFRTLVEETAAHARELFSDIARRHKMNLVVSFYELADDRILNTAALFGRDGKVIGRYHKVHLPVSESWFCTPGDGFPAFETDVGLVGIIICYDDMWPESTLTCALNGARIICHPLAAGSPPECRVRTRAMDSHVFYITSSYRGSCIVGPSGSILAEARGNDRAVITVDADVAHASLARENHWETLYSGIRDQRERHLKLRRPDAYGALTASAPPALKSYPPGGLANTPEAIRVVYEKQKEDYRRVLRGEKGHYEW